MTPGRLDPAVLRRHLLALDAAVQTLRRSQGVPLATLETDRERLWIVERGLQLCAQNVLDVATHLAAAAGRDVADYANAIDRLAELGIVSREFASRLRGLAGFRNILVHGYLEVDIARVHELLERHLDDFGEFALRVEVYLSTAT